jgi:hypothetical protein
LCAELNVSAKRHQQTTRLAQPGVGVFQLLAARGVLRMWVPDTILFGQEDQEEAEVWLRSNEGAVNQFHGFSDRDVLQTLTRGLPHDAMVAVVKKPEAGGTDTAVLDGHGLAELLKSKHSYGNFAVQRLVQPGRGKAFVTRVVWRRAGAPEGWVVTNNRNMTAGDPGSYLAQAVDKVTTIDRLQSQAVLGELSTLSQLVAEQLQRAARPVVSLASLVADWTKDDRGRWWLLQVRGWSLTPRVELQSKARRTDAQHTRPCRCCFRQSPEAALASRLTENMIVEMLEHQKGRGVSFSWHGRPEHQPLVWKAARLKAVAEAGQPEPPPPPGGIGRYAALAVCAPCYAMYQAEMKLRAAAAKLATQVGITKVKFTGLTQTLGQL